MGKSLTFRGAVNEASELLKNHRCKDPICDTNLWKVKHELDVARLKMRNLEAELLAKGIVPETSSDIVRVENVTPDCTEEDDEITDHRDK